MTRAFCSWSGGKDCCLAMHRAVEAGYQPEALVTMMIEDGRRSRSHGLRLDVLEAQARAMGLPLYACAASWAVYEHQFVAMVGKLVRLGLTVGVFGDIDGQANRAWEESACRQAGAAALLPVWHAPRRAMLDEMLQRGIVVRVVAAREGKLDRSWLGRTLDAAAVDELVRLGIDPCGENGEYHTVVTDAPLFDEPLDLAPGEPVLRDGVWFLDYDLNTPGEKNRA